MIDQTKLNNRMASRHQNQNAAADEDEDSGGSDESFDDVEKQMEDEEVFPI